MILVTGANGHLGSTTIDHLLEKKPDAEIAGLVRSEEKGEELKKKELSCELAIILTPAPLKRHLTTWMCWHLSHPGRLKTE